MLLVVPRDTYVLDDMSLNWQVGTCVPISIIQWIGPILPRYPYFYCQSLALPRYFRIVNVPYRFMSVSITWDGNTGAGQDHVPHLGRFSCPWIAKRLQHTVDSWQVLYRVHWCKATQVLRHFNVDQVRMRELRLNIVHLELHIVNITSFIGHWDSVICTGRMWITPGPSHWQGKSTKTEWCGPKRSTEQRREGNSVTADA